MKIKGKALIEFILVTACSNISLFISEHYNLKGIDLFLYPTMGAVISYILFRVILVIPTNYYFFRKLIFDESIFEGDWIEYIVKDDTIYYSFFTINYDIKSNKLTVQGIAYDENGKHHATWRSDNLEVKGYEVSYTYKAQQNFECSIYGFTFLSFHQADDTEFNDGIGYFIDMGKELKRCDFLFTKVRPSDKKELIGTNKLKTLDDKERFISEYNKKYREKIIFLNEGTDEDWDMKMNGSRRMR